MAVPIQLWQFTVRDYDRMLASGILNDDDRVELIDGEVREMSPIGELHASTVDRLTELMVKKVGRRAIVRTQGPIVLNDFTKPQPDLVLLHRQDDFYATRTPQPDDIFLVVEVSDTTLDYDRLEKTPRYAAAGIAEVWIIDVFGQSIEQYSQPAGGGYRQVETLQHGQSIRSKSLEQLALEVSDVLG
ncbi:MAG: Uma2 family endonuclease [Pirellulales bacterium]